MFVDSCSCNCRVSRHIIKLEVDGKVVPDHIMTILKDTYSIGPEIHVVIGNQYRLVNVGDRFTNTGRAFVNHVTLARQMLIFNIKHFVIYSNSVGLQSYTWGVLPNALGENDHRF